MYGDVTMVVGIPYSSSDVRGTVKKFPKASQLAYLWFARGKFEPPIFEVYPSSNPAPAYGGY